MKPLIGITTGTIRNKERPLAPYVYGQSHTYVDAVRKAGGTPILLPITEDIEELKRLLSLVNGVLFSGGSDIEPKHYGQPVTYAKHPDGPRDICEIELMKLALAEHKPVLAICRGMQLLNVLRGGTLYQDILTEVPGTHNHDDYDREDNSNILMHPIDVTAGSELARILGTTKIDATTFHHQAVKDLGADLTVNAMSDDGLIEGIEDMRAGYVMAVQAHPESVRPDNHDEWHPLFESFVQASQKS